MLTTLDRAVAWGERVDVARHVRAACCADRDDVIVCPGTTSPASAWRFRASPRQPTAYRSGRRSQDGRALRQIYDQMPSRSGSSPWGHVPRRAGCSTPHDAPESTDRPVDIHVPGCPPSGSARRSCGSTRRVQPAFRLHMRPGVAEDRGRSPESSRYRGGMARRRSSSTRAARGAWLRVTRSTQSSDLSSVDYPLGRGARGRLLGRKRWPRPQCARYRCPPRVAEAEAEAPP
jgi:hypothetical protein